MVWRLFPQTFISVSSSAAISSSWWLYYTLYSSGKYLPFWESFVTFITWDCCPLNRPTAVLYDSLWGHAIPTHPGIHVVWSIVQPWHVAIVQCHTVPHHGTKRRSDDKPKEAKGASNWRRWLTRFRLLESGQLKHDSTWRQWWEVCGGAWFDEWN